MKTRLLAVAGTTARTVTNSRGVQYTAAPGTVVDVEDFQSSVSGTGPGGSFVNLGLAGTTAERPTQNSDGSSIKPGFRFIDSTLGALIVWDGAAWRDVTGAAV
jgi:hypothetical protein